MLVIVRELDSIRRCWPKNIHKLENVDYCMRLKTIHLFLFNGKLLQHDMIGSTGRYYVINIS